MIAAVYAEWLLLRRRPLLRVVGVAILLLVLLQLGSLLAILLLAPQINARTPQPQFTEPQLELLRRTAVLPGGVGTALGQVNGLGGVLLMILAGAAMGSEYSWGTLRPQLARQPNRLVYLTAKLLAIVAATALIVLLAALFGGVVSALIGVIIGVPGSFQLADLGRALFAAARSVLIVLPYLALAVLGAIIGRSVISGIGIALGYWLADTIMGTLTVLRLIGDWGNAIYNLMLGQSVNTLTLANNRLFGVDATEIVSPQLNVTVESLSVGRAVVTLLAYLAIFLAAAMILFQRRDVTSAQ